MQLYPAFCPPSVLCTATTTNARRRPGPLQKWRLKRVVEFIDGHIGDPIRLPDLAAAAGLTRMHFAAQFRATFGVRPHDYVLRRRIDRACELLCNPDLALVEVALSVGFQTQAHFTTVFRELIGETPHRWRHSGRGTDEGAGAAGLGRLSTIQ